MTSQLVVAPSFSGRINPPTTMTRLSGNRATVGIARAVLSDSVGRIVFVAGSNMRQLEENVFIGVGGAAMDGAGRKPVGGSF